MPDEEIKKDKSMMSIIVVGLIIVILILGGYMLYDGYTEDKLEKELAFNQTIDGAFTNGTGAGAYQILVSIAQASQNEEQFILNLGNETNPLYFEFGARQVQIPQ